MMSQAFAAGLTSALIDGACTEALPGLTGETKCALIVAEHGLDVLCTLLRRGCPAATVVRPGEKPDSDCYALIVVPKASDFETPDMIVRLACRYLARDGVMMMRVADDATARALGRRLRLNGFSVSRPLADRNGLMLRASRRSDRPVSGGSPQRAGSTAAILGLK